jgi:hypothetical protein
LNGFIGVGIDTEQYVFVAGIIAIFYSVDYRAVAGGEGDKASLLACIYLVPFFIGIYTSNPQLSSSASFLRLNVLSSLN